MKREMPILFFVNCERTVLFFVKRDLDPPFLYTLLSGISKAYDVYFWLGMADSTNGRQGD